jgi:carboxymethylenebutenolidase
MSNQRRTVPTEAVELYNKFIHGEINRREFLSGARKFAIAGLTAGAIVEALMPDYASAQQVSSADERLHTSYISIPSPKGNGVIRGYLVRPVSADPRNKPPVKLPGILVVHENRGLNPHIEDVTRRLALENFMTFAPDVLTTLGGWPGDDTEAIEMYRSLSDDKKFEDMLASAQWLKAREDCTGKIGATGFCFGGSVSNQLAVRMGADLAAAVPYYGGVPKPEDIPKIKAAILVHHGALDTRLSESWPAYDKALTAAHVPHEGHIYANSVHGFNNDATPERYNRAASTEAWTHTVDWFNKYLKG